MSKLKPCKAKEIIAVLCKVGFYIHHRTGSHAQLRHIEKHHLRVTVPRHDKFDIPPSIVQSILKQAEITRGEFIKFL